MIVQVEGARHAGKTYLLNRFFEQNKDSRIEYYKWYLVDWVKTLKLEARDEYYSDLHYLSLGNILTIFDQMKSRNDKIVVFDRALITAYVWAQLRNRLTKSQCDEQIKAILSSDCYKNVRTVYIDPNPMFVEGNLREKDMWDKAVEFKAENDLMYRYMLENRVAINDAKRGNRYYTINNEFNEETVEIFSGMLDSWTELINT